MLHPIDPDDAWLDTRVEAFVDGELPPDEQAAFERALADDDRWLDALAEAQHVRRGLKAHVPSPCPEALTQRILRAAAHTPRRPAPRKARAGRDRTASRRGPSRRATALGAAVLTCVLAASAVLWPARRAPEPPPLDLAMLHAEPDVQQALAEAKWTLAYLSDLGREAGTSVRRSAIVPLMPPVEKAVDGVLDDPSLR